jgi:sensor histidine kinase
MKMLRTICKQYTKLSKKNIEKLEKISEGLPVLSKLLKADVFIDCMTESRDTAIVVAEANPRTGSSYTQSVVGKYAYRRNEPAVLRTLETGHPSRDYKALTQENKIVTQNVVPIKSDEDDKVIIAVLIVEEGVNEESLNKELSFLNNATDDILISSVEMSRERRIIDYINDGIIIFNEEGVCIYANSRAKYIYRKIGYKDFVLGEKFDNIVIDNVEFEDVLSGKMNKKTDISISNMVLSMEYFLIKETENIKNIVLFIKDITEIKVKEKELVLKSVVIKEIHHRVKNNLQTIASLLRIQARKTDDKAVKAAFSDSINRILSISVTHELLAQNGLDELEIKEVINKILKNSLRENLDGRVKLKIDVTGDNFEISSDKATTIALIVNELVENCIKHAFKGKDNGRITVKVKRGEMKSYISISDDGIGMNEKDFDKGSIGLQIVKSLVKEKLYGDLNVKTGDKGTEISFGFEN